MAAREVLIAPFVPSIGASNDVLCLVCAPPRRRQESSSTSSTSSFSSSGMVTAIDCLPIAFSISINRFCLRVSQVRQIIL